MSSDVDPLGETASDDVESDVADALEDALRRYEAGGGSALRAYLDGHPHAEEVRALLPMMDGLAALGGDRQSDPPNPRSEEPHPERLGDFRILREVGRGGMGIVYEAEQITLGRRVALKVLPTLSALEPRHLQRFRNEMHAAASLHHQHLVPVFATGIEHGVHYYAMQFVEGRTLADLIVELRDLAGRSTTQTDAASLSLTAAGWSMDDGQDGSTTSSAPSLSAVGGTSAAARTFYRTAARLMIHVAEALEYAHERGVIHRDVKPANLMLDLEGDVWLTDFGLAQVHGGAGLTRTGELLGTLRYMSPEQALGTAPIDHRADVYALAASFYELLTLQPVHDGADRPTLLGQVAHEEVRPPRRLRPDMPIDLDTILSKALCREPADRYATAGAMAEDLQRFLDDRPIRARRPSLWQRACKLARRHRAAVLSAAAATLIGGVAIIIGLVHSRQVILEQVELKEEQRAEAVAARALAADREEVALAALESLVRDAQELAADAPGSTGLRTSLLERALVQLDDLGLHADQASDVDRSRARAHRLLGSIHLLAGQTDRARGYFERALALSRALHEREPDEPAHGAVLVEAGIGLGDAHVLGGRMADAERAYADALDAARSGVESAAAAGDRRQRLSAALHLSDAMRVVAAAHEHVGRSADARRGHERALRVAESALASYASTPGEQADATRTVTSCALALGAFLRQLGNVTSSRVVLRDALEQEDALADEERRPLRDAFLRLRLLRQLAETEYALGDLETADRIAQRGIALADELLEASPSHQDTRDGWLALAYTRARVALDANRIEAADELAREAARVAAGWRARRPAGAGGRAESTLELVLARIAARSGRTDDAKRHLRAAIEADERLVAALPRDRSARGNLSVTHVHAADQLLLVLRDPEAATSHYDAARDLREALAEDATDFRAQRNLASLYGRLARAAAREGDAKAALDLWRRAAARLIPAVEAHPGDALYLEPWAQLSTAIGAALEAQGELTEARAHFTQALDALERLVHVDPGFRATRTSLAETHAHLAGMSWKSGDETTAAAHFLPAARILLDLPIPTQDVPRRDARINDSILRARVAWFLAASRSHRRAKESLVLAEQAAAAFPRFGGFQRTLGFALFRAGRHGAAVETLQAYVETAPDDELSLRVLALASHALGHGEAARTWNAKAEVRARKTSDAARQSWEPALEDLRRDARSALVPGR